MQERADVIDYCKPSPTSRMEHPKQTFFVINYFFASGSRLILISKQDYIIESTTSAGDALVVTDQDLVADN
jgi:hypothetical protein